MKKKFLMILPLILAATACNNNSSDLKVLCPTGAPALAFYNYANTNTFETNGSPANIVSTMTDNGNDVIVIDTVSGVKAVQSGSPYKLAANITFGNFYIASTGNDDNNVMDKDDSIVLFGMGQTPQKVFELLYGTDFTNITYVQNVSEASKCLISKKTPELAPVDYVFVAEPALTSALKNNKDASIYANIQDLYKEKTNKEMIQAGVFVKNSVTASQRKKFLNNLKNDIDALLDDSDLISSNEAYTAEDFEIAFGIKQAIAKEAIANDNRIGLGYKAANNNFASIKEFCSLFNVELTENEIYK